MLRHHLLWGLGLGVSVVLCIQVLTWIGLGLTHWTWFSTYVLVVYDLNTFADNNDQFTTRILANSDVTATGATSSASITPSGAPVYGSLLTVKTTGGTGNLTLTEGLNNPVAGFAANDAQDLAVLQFTLSASNVEDITLSSVEVGSSGTADENADITRAELFEDVDGDGLVNLVVDNSIATSQTFASDDGTVTFTVSGQTISQGGSKDYLVSFDLAGTATSTETLQASILANIHIVGQGVTSTATISPVSGTPLSGGTQTISSVGAVTVALGSNTPASTNEATGGTGIAMMQLALSANATEDVNLTSLTLATSGTADESTDISQVRLFEDVNDNGTLELATDNLLSTIAGASITSNDQDLTFTITNTLSASETNNYLVVYDLAGTASNGETFSLSFDSNADLSGTGATSSMAVSVTGAPVNANTKTIGTTGSLVILFIIFQNIL